MLFATLKNPYLKASEWGWQIDPLRSSNYNEFTYMTVIKNHYLLWKMD